MPYVEHPIFSPPPSPDSKIWRYMDLAKFLSILDRCSLYFSRVDNLSEFDPFEGYYTKLDLEFENQRFEDMPEEWKNSTGIKEQQVFDSIIDMQRNMRELVHFHRQVTFVNSWHIKEHESAAMWKLYLSNNEGIAVQSTYKSLIDSLVRYDDFEIHIGCIKYIDFEKEGIPKGNLLSPFIHKRKSFEHEDELRALIWTPQHGKNDLVNPKNNIFKDTFGIYVPVDLNTLVNKVFIAPNAPAWMAELIRSVTKKLGLEKEVVQSDLASKPLY